MPNWPEHPSRGARQHADSEAHPPSIASLVRAALRAPQAPVAPYGGGLPLPQTPPAFVPPGAQYAVTVIGASGRLASRAPLAALGWLPRTPLSITIAHGAIVVEVDDDSAITISDRRYLHLPAAIRHQCHVHAGDRLLATAQVGSGLLLLYPEAVLDSVLLAYHRSRTFRGEQ
ncbi:hypothetical protein ACIA8K_29860 [Catenuloplanes sp. NPDC051500]|uniref:hypothetical protein n=1 Tax=Catenuloplanes sp. NPDC051500 TaxID=3363959 RepID=UPI0037B84A51